MIRGDIILYVGVDIIEIDRIRKAVTRIPRFQNRVFTPQELDYCLKKRNPYPSLAARFAAKEALRKLHPAFSSGISFHDVEVINNSSGKPELLLHGKAMDIKVGNGIGDIAISLSHSNYTAIAVVTAMREGEYEGENLKSGGDEGN
ncbi:MAG: holo-ACP synthase [Syntrophomonadaceae bacterium]